MSVTETGRESYVKLELNGGQICLMPKCFSSPSYFMSKQIEEVTSPFTMYFLWPF